MYFTLNRVHWGNSINFLEYFLEEITAKKRRIMAVGFSIYIYYIHPTEKESKKGVYLTNTTIKAKTEFRKYFDCEWIRMNQDKLWFFHFCLSVKISEEKFYKIRPLQKVMSIRANKSQISLLSHRQKQCPKNKSLAFRVVYQKLNLCMNKIFPIQ